MIVPLSPKHLIHACTLFEDVKAHMEEQNIPQWDEIYPHRTHLEKDLNEGTAMGLRWADLESPEWRDRNGLAGYLTINQSWDPEYDEIDWTTPTEGVAIIHRLVVHPELQGRGLAKKIMGAGEEHARRMGYRSIRLDAFLSNPAAMKLYPALGYRRAGTISLRKGDFAVFEKNLIKGI